MQINATKSQLEARPHPGPLPRGEGEPSAAAWRQNRCFCFLPRLGTQAEAGTATEIIEVKESGVTLSLSAGERAGVRAGIITNDSIYLGNPLKHCLHAQTGQKILN